MKINETKKDFILVFFALALLFSLSSLLIIETYNVKGKAEKYRKEISEKIDKNKQLREAKNLLKKTKEGTKKLHSYFVEDKKEVSFIEYIESLGDVANVSIITNSVKVLNYDQNKLLKKMEMNISVEGSRKEIFSFLSLLENISYDFYIKNFRIENIKKEDIFTPVWKGAFNFLVFKFKS